MKKIIGLVAVLAAACTEIEPVEVIAPVREIDTQALTQYKENLSQRQVVIGMMYNWGKAHQSILVQTPDSLDVIVVKDGYQKLSVAQQEDLQQVKNTKATRVLLGVDFEQKNQEYLQDLEQKIAQRIAHKDKEIEASAERLTSDKVTLIKEQIKQDTQAEFSQLVEKELKELVDNALAWLSNGFDGISIAFPSQYNNTFSPERLGEFLSSVSEKLPKDAYLILENPNKINPELVKRANWVVFRTGDNTSLRDLTNAANSWDTQSFVPSADFSSETLEKGFSDTERFPIQNKLFEVISWQAPNKKGVAYYHIELQYNDVQGGITYKTLRRAIQKLQTTNP